MKTILSFFILASLQSQAVEYICWQMPALQGLAFESSAVNCPGGKKEKGSVAQRNGVEKKTVCMIPAMCLALTSSVVQILQAKTGLSQLSDIKKLDGKMIHMALLNTPFMGRQSTLICEGSGSVKANSYGILALDEAKCPSFTACANSEEIFYNQSVGFPIPSDLPRDPMTNPTPVKTAPTEVSQ